MGLKKDVCHDVQSAGLPSPSTSSTARGRPKLQSKLRKLLASVVLFSVAATLSTILPTPWSLFQLRDVSGVAVDMTQSNPAEDWEDNVWPLRPQDPWDISTDYPFPRKLEYDVQEGTWLRLDVHPTSGDIIFDMVGDIYCLPGSEALRAGLNRAPIKALPVLTGVPHDSDPHFSPEGDRLVFRSDAELGVENIWVTEWKGCEEMDVRPADGGRDDLRMALIQQADEEDLLAKGIREDSQRKMNRLVREGRFNSLCQVFFSSSIALTHSAFSSTCYQRDL